MSAAVARGRYAPSPTGSLHLGNLRTALLAWLFARHAGGRFVLRMEDLDRPRVRPDALQGQLTDLHWLGLDWDEGPDMGGPYGPYMQSQRQALYDQELARLRASGLLYPCFCTRAQLSRIASAPQGDEQLRYPGTCRKLSSAQQRRLEATGKRPALRFHAPEAAIMFGDTVMGEITESVQAAVGDFVVRRSDGITAYHAAVVVDDALMGISQVVRGADLLASTARQLALYHALGYRPPLEYAHVPLALDTTGARMAKRDSSAGIAPLRMQGTTPERVLGALAASCGLLPPGRSATLSELLTAFTPALLQVAPSQIVV